MSSLHLYNEWLPQPVAEAAAEIEPHKFHLLIQALRATVNSSGDDSSPLDEDMKLVSLAISFIKTKTRFPTEDVDALADVVLTAFLRTSEDLFAQRRWGVCLGLLMRKYKDSLHITVPWRQLFDILRTKHLSSRATYTGVVHHYHLGQLTSLIRRSRRFFPPGAAAEIWEEVRPLFQDVSHNDAMEALGILSLFIPTAPLRQLDGQPDPSSKWSEWMQEWFKLWSLVPHCNYWDSQWVSLFGRCSRDLPPGAIDWEAYLPSLFTFYLGSFELPVGKSQGSAPVARSPPSECSRVFTSSWKSTADMSANALVLMLGSGRSTQTRLELLIDLTEPYYHPSNGGAWSRTLGKFMRALVRHFVKRVARERRVSSGAKAARPNEVPLTAEERSSFVCTLLRLVKLAQFSKSNTLAGNAAKCASDLAYVEPTAVLPLVLMRFESAMETVTATHQLEASLDALSECTRTLLLASHGGAATAMDTDAHVGDGRGEGVGGPSPELIAQGRELLASAMERTLPGLDANDPPKTLATLDLFRSIVCNIGTIGDEVDGGSGVLPMDWSVWLEEFLSRLFALLRHLERNNDTDQTGTFLRQSDSAYQHVVEVLFARLTPPLYKQALRRVSKFALESVVPGAAYEVGDICLAAVYASPREGMAEICVPLMDKILASLEGTPTTGFSQNAAAVDAETKTFPTLSQAMEVSVAHDLTVLSVALSSSGVEVLPHKAKLLRVIAAALDAPATEVYEAGGRVLRNILWGLVLFYEQDIYRVPGVLPDSGNVEVWVGKKGESRVPAGSGLKWHVPTPAELAFAHEILDAHFSGALSDLKAICESATHAGSSSGAVWDRERLRVVLIRLTRTLTGIRSALADFRPDAQDAALAVDATRLVDIVGWGSAEVKPTFTRDSAAEVLHLACEFMKAARSDDTINMKLLLSAVDVLANYGCLEYADTKSQQWSRDLRGLRLRNPSGTGHQRPMFLVAERTYSHMVWRASQAGYRRYYLSPDGRSGRFLLAPPSLRLLTLDLVGLSLSTYKAIRSAAMSPLERILNRYPPLVTGCLPALASALSTPGPKEAAIGACTLFGVRALMRKVAQDWNAMATFITAILASEHHEDVKAQQAVSDAFLGFAMRFSGLPPPLPASSAAGPASPTLSYDELLANMRAAASAKAGTGPGGASHWRYTLMANCFLLFLVLPQEGAHSVSGQTIYVSIIGHFLHNLSSEIPAILPIAIAALVVLVQHVLRGGDSGVDADMDADVVLPVPAGGALADEFATALQQEAGFPEAVIRNLAYNHQMESPEGGGAGDMGRMSRGSSMILFALAAMAGLKQWPKTKSREPSLGNSGFSIINAVFFRDLVIAGGPAVLEAFHGPLQAAVRRATERGSQCIVAEAIAGFLQAGTPAVADALEARLWPLMLEGLMQSPAELVVVWGACIRYAATGLGRGGATAPALRMRVLECVTAPLPSGAPAAQVTKRLTFIGACLGELRPGPRIAAEAAIVTRLLNELEGLMSHAAQQVREAVGALLAIILAKLPSAAAPNGGALTTAAPVTSADAVSGSPLSREDAVRVLFGKVSTAAAVIQGMGNRPESAPEAGGAAPAPSSSSPLTVDDEAQKNVQRDAVRWMETVLYFAIAVIKSGDDSLLSSTIVGLIPFLLSLQETADHDFSVLAKRALAYTKYMPLSTLKVHDITLSLVSAADAPNWHTRAASLNFMQSFVYRHAFTMAQEDLAALRATVVRLLDDRQIEVRELAASTLAGLLKVADEEWATHVRATFMKSVKDAQAALVTAKRKKGKSGATPAAVEPAASRHGAILGLSACILCSPYTIPSWLPELVIALANSAHDQQPVRGTVAKTFGDFQRTHQDTWAIDRSKFSEEQLEVLVDMQAAPSYFV